ncbi:hypothetical protein RFI_11930 [Reticulomyxa filosa]|uniref:Uncharacterized protein n=1 Tax=Reticulomyxa filosa TaxID=46433 RepID=X6NFW0_RETFI|nr:hypothetical protein RFI_11930 [Reticulomyxa filosa]|eukprot:ETO25210.1 hypothetical protein RFI_11930 [Reticulomyxa filosa]
MPSSCIVPSILLQTRACAGSALNLPGFCYFPVIAITIPTYCHCHWIVIVICSVICKTLHKFQLAGKSSRHYQCKQFRHPSQFIHNFHMLSLSLSICICICMLALTKTSVCIIDKHINDNSRGLSRYQSCQCICSLSLLPLQRLFSKGEKHMHYNTCIIHTQRLQSAIEIAVTCGKMMNLAFLCVVVIFKPF